jgi:type I restriction enzyme S subunit
MSDWQLVRLGDVVESTLGKMLDANKNKGSLEPYLGNSNVRWGQFDLSDLAQMRFEPHEAERYGISAGDLIVCEGGEPGRCAIWRDELPNMKIQKALHRVRTKSALNNRYLFYWFMLAGRTGHLEPHFTGTTIKHLTGRALAALKIPLPPLREQRGIASVLGALDDKIELNRRMNETLEEMAKAIFKDWFVDFGPTRAKIEGRAPYLTPEIWSLFPDRLDDEGKPKGWGFGILGDLAKQVGESVQPEALDPGTPYIGLEHMPRRSIALSEWECANKVTSGKLRFRKGDFLFGKLRPYFHKVGIAPLDGICSTDIVVLNAREPKATAFVLVCISQDEFVAYTDRTSDGTKMPRTSWGRMERYNLCLPSGSTIEAFKACVEPMVDRIVSNIHESRALAEMRDFLLPKLMSGEVRVKDAEKHVGEAI